MCANCWEELGSSQIDSAAVRAAATAIRAVYDHSCVGGHLHIALDDWNLDDGNLESCGQWLDEDPDADIKQADAERHCLRLLKAMPEDERESALALHYGFWTPAGAPTP